LEEDEESGQTGNGHGRAEEAVIEADPLDITDPRRRDGEADDDRDGGQYEIADETDLVGDEEHDDGEQDAVQGGEEGPDGGRKAVEGGQGCAHQAAGDRRRGRALGARLLLLEGHIAGARVGDAALEEAEKAVDEEDREEDDEDEQDAQDRGEGRIFRDDGLEKEIASEEEEGVA
jgi:hypothetical protein